MIDGVVHHRIKWHVFIFDEFDISLANCVIGIGRWNGKTKETFLQNVMDDRSRDGSDRSVFVVGSGGDGAGWSRCECTMVVENVVIGGMERWRRR